MSDPDFGSGPGYPASSDETGTTGNASGEGGTLGTTAGSDDGNPSGADDGSSGSDPGSCGNGVIDDGEACDGTDLAGQDCGSFGFDDGVVACKACSVVTDGCFSCGDGTKQATEECDGADMGGATCESAGDYAGGQLACSADCTLDTAACLTAQCGDGMQNQPSEECDGMDLAQATCESVGDFVDGDLACNPDCTFDTAACIEPICGDGEQNQVDEDCDGNDLAGNTCETVGFDAGDLACNPDCTFDTAGCLVCQAQLEDCQTDDECCPGLSCSGWPLFWCN